jgi:hypothetical protein
MKKYFIFLFLTSTIHLNVSPPELSDLFHVFRDVRQTPVDKLLQKRKKIDDYKGGTVERLVGLPGRSELIQIVNGKFPPGYDRLFKIQKDKAGKVLFIVESLYGKSDEWMVNHTMYYDELENVFAYERHASFSNSMCTDRNAFETITYYYGTGEKVLKKNYQLTDFYGKPLKKDLCKFPYNFDYEVIFSYKEFAKAKNIMIRT